MATPKVRFATEAGDEFDLVAVREVTVQLAAARVEREFRERGEPIDPPTYQVTNSLGGEVITLPLEGPTPEQRDEAGNVLRPATPGSLDVRDDPEATALRHALWNRYQMARFRMYQAQVAARYEALIFLGFRVEVPTDDDWLEDQLMLGFDMPKDGKERKLRYIGHICNERDMTRAISMLQLLQSGIGASEEKIAEYEALFRRSLRGEAPAGVERALATLRRVLGDDEIRGTDGGEELGGDKESE